MSTPTFETRVDAVAEAAAALAGAGAAGKASQELRAAGFDARPFPGGDGLSVPVRDEALATLKALVKKLSRRWPDLLVVVLRRQAGQEDFTQDYLPEVGVTPVTAAPSEPPPAPPGKNTPDLAAVLADKEHQLEATRRELHALETQLKAKHDAEAKEFRLLKQVGDFVGPIGWSNP